MITRLQRLGHAPSLLPRVQRSFVTSRHGRRIRQPGEVANVIRHIDTGESLVRYTERNLVRHIERDPAGPAGSTLVRRVRFDDTKDPPSAGHQPEEIANVVRHYHSIVPRKRGEGFNYPRRELPPMMPEAHWAFSGAYRVGTEIKKAEGALSPDGAFSSEDDLIPGFDNEKVLLKINTLPHATITHLLVEIPCLLAETNCPFRPNFWLRWEISKFKRYLSLI